MSSTPISSLAHPQPVILIARPAAGGIRSHLISLLTHLDRSKFQLTLAAPRSLLETLPPDLPGFEGVLLPITSKPTPLDFIAARQIAQLASKKSDAIVHAHGVRAGFVSSLARQVVSFPLVVTHHNIPPRGSISHMVLEMIDFGCAAIVAVSNAIAEQIPGTDTTVIPNGIKVDAYGKVPRIEAKAKLALREDRFIAAYLGRLSGEKGPDLILRTALMCPNVTFLIGGDGPEKQRLMRSAPWNVTLMGRVPDPTVLLSAADIVIIPSRTEGQGIVALEAMASRTPAIASRVGGLIETIEQSGCGILVAPERPDLIAQALTQLKNHPERRCELAKAGAEWVRGHGRIEQQIAEVERLYGRLGD